jgi:O-antigen ligase
MTAAVQAGSIATGDGRGWRALLRPGPLFDGAFVAFTAAAFLVRPTPLWALLFYAIMVPIFVRALVRRERAVARVAEIAVIAALLLYMGASILWSAEADSPRRLKYLVAILTNGAFIAAAVAFFRDAEQRLLRLFVPVLLAAAALNVALSLVLHVLEAGVYQRLEGWAETRQSVLGGLVISLVFSLLLAHAARQPAVDWRLVALGVALLAFIALTRSRSAMVTAAAAAGIALFHRHRGTAVWIVAVAVLPLLAVAAVQPEVTWRIIAELAERADSSRLMIWRITWEQIALRPLLGHGLANVFPIAEPFTHPHNLYLAMLYYGGVVGLLLYMALLGSLAVRAVRSWRTPERLLFLMLFAHVVLAGAFTLAQLFRDVSEQWLILWLPIAMIIGLAVRRERAD